MRAYLLSETEVPGLTPARSPLTLGEETVRLGHQLLRHGEQHARGTVMNTPAVGGKMRAAFNSPSDFLKLLNQTHRD